VIGASSGGAAASPFAFGVVAGAGDVVGVIEGVTYPPVASIAILPSKTAGGGSAGTTGTSTVAVPPGAGVVTSGVVATGAAGTGAAVSGAAVAGVVSTGSGAAVAAAGGGAMAGVA
jgi:hypothetical protein